MKRLLILVTFLGLTAHFCDVQGSAEISQEALDRQLIKAAASRDIDSARIRDLLDAGANVNAVDRDGKTALMSAATGGHRDVVELLLQARANVNAASNNGWTALTFAARGGHREIVRLLLQAGADVNVVNRYRETALMYALEGGHREVVAELLSQAGINLNTVSLLGKTVLMCAAEGGHREVVVKLLSQAGANVNAANSTGMTVLMYAAAYGHREVVELLLQADANVNAVDNNRLTALMLAAQRGHREVVRLLLQARANVNAANSTDMTALMLAAQGGHREVVAELLSQAGINLNTVSYSGRTALMYAVVYHRLEVVKKLLLAGADVTIGDTMQELRRLPDSPTKRNILLVFDALKPGIEQELEDALKQESGQEQESEQVRPLKRQIIEAYEQFLHGDHNDLRNLLFVLSDTMQKRMNGEHVFISFTADAMLNVFKKESIKPLLYFLAETRWQKKVADDLLDSMLAEWTNDQVSDEQIASDFIVVEKYPKV